MFVLHADDGARFFTTREELEGYVEEPDLPDYKAYDSDGRVWEFEIATPGSRWSHGTVTLRRTDEVRAEDLRALVLDYLRRRNVGMPEDATLDLPALVRKAAAVDQMHMRPDITVETDRFEHREVKSHFINPCCFGEDFAVWLKAQLGSIADFGFDLSNLFREDYGWGFRATRNSDRFWIAICYVGSGPQEPPAQWVIGVSPDPGLNVLKRIFRGSQAESLAYLRGCVRRVLTNASGIRVIETAEVSTSPLSQQ